ncbi:hypothetical protein FQR65_LT09379 [Abscondita terminalis]|nr:hypothetical protein FQR65_LT09379 [Abscondita terminalis]
MNKKKYEEENNVTVREIQDILKKIQNIHYASGPIYSKSNKISSQLAAEDDELEKIYHLVEAHSPNLRFNTIHQFEKCTAGSDSTPPLNKSYIHFQCNTASLKEKIGVMLDQISDMPKEWTIIQLTSQLNPEEHFSINSESTHTNAIYITVFNCGTKESPFTTIIRPPLNKPDGDVIQIREEMCAILKENVKSLENFKMFCGKNTMDAAAKLLYSDVRFSLNNRWRSLIKGGGILSITEIINALSYIFPEDCDKEMRVALGKDIQQMQVAHDFSHQTRHPVILIVDEKLDVLPWEMLDVLENHPASRMPCLHFTYCLYKEYESNITDGMVTSISGENGTYLINPGLDLKNMENRLKSFLKYWVPDWNGLIGVAPSEDDFKNLLSDGDVFIYSGHGNGTQYFASEKIQRMKINKVVLLFGCSSVSLTVLGPQVEMFGAYQTYLIACSPCIVGMLWAVTDVDTDLLTTEFLSQWIPSQASMHWKLVDKKKWEVKGNTGKTKTTLNESEKHEPELLRALCKAKKAARQSLIRAACVARGLPVKIK